MLTLPPTVKIYIAAEPVDLRRGFDGLAATTRDVIRKDPMSGHLFAFLNRRRNRIKILLWDRSGYLLVYKRLSRGTFGLPSRPLPGQTHIELDPAQMLLMLEGIELAGAKQRVRFSRS